MMCAAGCLLLVLCWRYGEATIGQSNPQERRFRRWVDVLCDRPLPAAPQQLPEACRHIRRHTTTHTKHHAPARALAKNQAPYVHGTD